MSTHRRIKRIKRSAFLVTGVIVSATVVLIVSSALKQSKSYEERTVCVGNLARLRLTKAFVAQELDLTNGTPIPEDSLIKIGREGIQFCPAGGDYIVGPIGIDPQCTFTQACNTWTFDWKTMRVKHRTWLHRL